MFSEKFSSLVDEQKAVLKIFWLIIPFEAILFMIIGYVLNMSLPASGLAINPKILYPAAIIFAVGGTIAGAFICKRLFLDKPVFSGQTTTTDESLQPEELAGLSMSERYLIGYFRGNIVKLVFAQSLFGFSLLGGLVVTALTRQTAAVIYAAAFSLVCWKIFVPTPETLIKRFLGAIQEFNEDSARRRTNS